MTFQVLPPAVWAILCVFGLTIFGWGIYYPVRNPHSAFGLPRSIITASRIIAALLYSVSAIALVGASFFGLPVLIKLFTCIGILLLFIVSGWIGFQIAEGENNSDYITMVRGLEQS